MRVLIYCGLMLGLVGVACNDTPTFEDQLEIDKKLIEEYAANNNLQGNFEGDGVYIVIEEEGTGTATPSVSSTVEIIYLGTLLDGTEFDSSEGFPVNFPVWRLIRGWQQGLTFFKKESKGIMLIPSGMAYGVRGTSSIPPNSVIRFDIELLDFTE